MILILGSSRDDILFFEASLNHPTKETLLDHYPFVRGTLFNQEIGIVSEVYTNVEASALTLYLMQKYFVLLVFSVGTCISYSDDLAYNHILVSDQVIFGDVDQTSLKEVTAGQVPNYPSFYPVSSEVLSFVLPCLASRLPNQYQRGTYVSTNTYMTDKKKLEPYMIEGRLFALEKSVALDCTSGGIALACEMTHTPFIVLKVAESHIGEKIDFVKYSEILKTYTELGKVILSVLSEIGSNDILEGGTSV